jgi:hypothetical protein
MTIRQTRFALPVLLALLIVVPGCRKEHPVKALGPLTISLAYKQGQCTQNGSTGTIDVEQDQDVTYVPASAGTAFNIQFSTCPFASGKCPVGSPQGTAQNVGAPTAATVNTTYYYSSVTINNHTCNNGVQSWGLRIKPVSLDR